MSVCSEMECRTLVHASAGPAVSLIWCSDLPATVYASLCAASVRTCVAATWHLCCTEERRDGCGTILGAEFGHAARVMGIASCSMVHDGAG